MLKDADELSTSFGQLVIAGASIAEFATVILLSVFFSQNGSGATSTIVLLVLFAALAATVGVLLAGALESPRLKGRSRGSSGRPPRWACGWPSCCWLASS